MADFSCFSDFFFDRIGVDQAQSLGWADLYAGRAARHVHAQVAFMDLGLEERTVCDPRFCCFTVMDAISIAPNGHATS